MRQLKFVAAMVLAVTVGLWGSSNAYASDDTCCGLSGSWSPSLPPQTGNTCPCVEGVCMSRTSYVFSARCDWLYACQQQPCRDCVLGLEPPVPNGEGQGGFTQPTGVYSVDVFCTPVGGVCAQTNCTVDHVVEYSTPKKKCWLGCTCDCYGQACYPDSPGLVCDPCTNTCHQVKF